MDQEVNNTDAVSPHKEKNRDGKDTRMKADVISVDTSKMQDPAIAIDEIKVVLQNVEKRNETNEANIMSVDTPKKHDPKITFAEIEVMVKYDIKEEIDTDKENKYDEDILTDQESSIEAMNIDDVKDDIFVSILSDEVLRLNPDFTTFNDLGYGRGLRRREKAIKKEPESLEKWSKPREHQKRDHKVHNSTNENNLIQCSYCSNKFQSKGRLSKHMRLHNVNNVQDLSQVIDNLHPINYKCALCKQLFETNEKLISHKKETHSNGDPFMCKRCKVAFSEHYDYLIHNMTHKRLRNIPIPCLECPKTFDSKKGYQMHIGLHFESRFPCDLCAKTFGCEYTLMMHKKRVHYKDKYNKSKTCPECHKVCGVGKGFSYHMLTHTGVKPYQCLYCGKGFRTTQARKIHTRIHTDEKPYECETCHRKFRQSGDLQRHQEYSHNNKEKRFACEICDKKFKNIDCLKIHQRRHTNTGLYKCPACDHTTTYRGSLRTHIIHMHTTERLHHCDICDVGFKMKMDLNRHLKTRRHRNNTFGVMKKKGVEE